jgi:hypothetical protein
MFFSMLCSFLSSQALRNEAGLAPGTWQPGGGLVDFLKTMDQRFAAILAAGVGK